MKKHSITPHEPNEPIVNSVEEAFRDAIESEKYWQEWERKQHLYSISIQLPEEEYKLLENLAEKQKKDAREVIQSLLHNILATLMPVQRE